MLKGLAFTAALSLWAPLVAAQSEVDLKQFFEGRTVTTKLAMPGTEDGVDIYPGTPRPLDYPKYADRLKDNGTAIRAGQPVIVTKIRVKQKHIEFQLDGGGYGTFGDETSSNVGTAQAPKTKREKNLEAELKREQDPAKRRAIREEIDDLKAAREREDARNRSAVAEAQEHRKQNIRQRRLEGGSRFNIRFRDGVPSHALSPEGVLTALGEYVDFGQLRTQTAVSATTGTPADGRNQVSPLTEQRESGALPRKGMLLRDVEALLGPAAKASERREGTLKVLTREYAASQGRITTEFVEGVLIRYTVSSE